MFIHIQTQINTYKPNTNIQTIKKQSRKRHIHHKSTHMNTNKIVTHKLKLSQTNAHMYMYEYTTKHKQA